MGTKVLALLATYNGEPWVRQQIDSVLAQEGVSVELAIRDDFSSDETVALIEHTYGGMGRVCVSRGDQPSGSAGANFRRLICDADSTGFAYVALCDQDDIWLPRKLIVAIDKIERSGASGYSSAVTAFWPDGSRRTLLQTRKMRAADFLFEGAGQGCTFVIPNATFNRIQQFCRLNEASIAELHYHDWLVYLLVRAWSLGWYFDSNSYILYRQHRGNEIGARRGLRAARKRLVLLLNGWFSAQVAAAARIYRIADGSEMAALTLCDLIERRGPALLSRRLKVGSAIMKDGRRKLSDRLVLFAVSLAGRL